MKTTELNGIALDWAVAVAKEHKDIKVFAPWRPTDRGWIEVRFNSDYRVPTARFDPTDDWGFAGPIIEHEKIELTYRPHINGGMVWAANVVDDYNLCSGPTPLIAAMRCFVRYKLGDVVELPVEITRNAM